MGSRRGEPRPPRVSHRAGPYRSVSAINSERFLDFALSHYVNVGIDELDQEKLTPLLRLKYHDSIVDALADLGRPEEIGRVFSGFQK
jgi:hypothetical protein